MLSEVDIQTRLEKSWGGSQSALLRCLAEKTGSIAMLCKGDGLLTQSFGISNLKSEWTDDQMTSKNVLEVIPDPELFQLIKSSVKEDLTYRRRLRVHNRDFEVHLSSVHLSAHSQLCMIVMIPSQEPSAAVFEVLNAAPFFVFSFDENGHCTHLNNAWKDFRKIDRHNPKSDWQEAFEPKDSLLFESQLQHSIKNLRAFEVELQAKRADGSPCWILWRGTPRISDQGTLVGFFVTGVDIARHKALQLSLEKSSRDLQRSNSELEEFAYVASHDLQEPLRMITSFIDLLREECSSSFDETAEEYMSFIQDAAVRMRSLIQDLLAYSRVERNIPNPVAISSEEALNLALNHTRTLVEVSHAKIEFGELPMVSADLNPLSQVFQNLIENAIKYRSASDPWIRISAVSRNSHWEFCVEDNGIGFDMRFHERIFQLFQRLHARDKYPGSGIGLAITKKIIETFGGHIWAKSIPGKGSQFFFSLPRAGSPT